MWLVKKDSSIHFYIADPNLQQIRILFAAVLSKCSFSRFHSFLKHKCPKCLRILKRTPCVREVVLRSMHAWERIQRTWYVMFLSPISCSWWGLSEHLWSAFQFSKSNWRTKYKMSVQSAYHVYRKNSISSSLFAPEDVPCIKPLLESITSA